MILLLALISTAPASQFGAERSVEDLAAESTAVVRGTVSAIETRRASVGLVSRYTIQTETCLLGPCEEEVHVLLPGGRADGLEQRFADVPLWSTGDEVVVFLPAQGKPQRLQGVFTVHGEELVDPSSRPEGLMPTHIPLLEARLSPLRTP